jgi:hypothetical protein
MWVVYIYHCVAHLGLVSAIVIKILLCRALGADMSTEIYEGPSSLGELTSADWLTCFSLVAALLCQHFDVSHMVG